MEVHPVRSGPITIGKLNSAHLSHEHSTLIDETLHSCSCGIARSVQGIVCTVSAACSETFDVEDVLYPESKLSGF